MTIPKPFNNSIHLTNELLFFSKLIKIYRALPAVHIREIDKNILVTLAVVVKRRFW